MKTLFIGLVLSGIILLGWTGPVEAQHLFVGPDSPYYRSAQQEHEMEANRERYRRQREQYDYRRQQERQMRELRERLDRQERERRWETR